MNMTEKNGQPSMEEILASIRRIIAEEPTSYPHNGELRGTPIVLRGDSALDDASEFDLPSIFRSSPPATAERQTPLLGRLTDAIRSATSSQPEPQPAAVTEAQTVETPASAAPTAGLSTLKSVRPETRNDAAPVDPGSLVNGKPLNGASLGSASQPASQQSGAFPAAPAPGSEPQRVMAPFKDTHFLRMSGPAPDVSAAPQPAPAPVEAPVQYAGPDFSSIISEVPEYPAATYAAEPVAHQEPIAMPPPPPLPSDAAAQPPQATFTAPASGASTSGEPSGTIEDATADLLRPMLRQWLADNMPRMVEKALHIEMAQSIKAPRKP